jgi:hypothetical protein
VALDPASLRGSSTCHGCVAGCSPGEVTLPHCVQFVARLAAGAVTLGARRDALILAGAVATPAGVGEDLAHTGIDALHSSQSLMPGPAPPS